MWQCTRGAILLEREHALVGEAKCETSSQFNRLLLRHQCAYFHIREQSTKLCRAYLFLNHGNPKGVLVSCVY